MLRYARRGNFDRRAWWISALILTWLRERPSLVQVRRSIQVRQKWIWEWGEKPFVESGSGFVEVVVPVAEVQHLQIEVCVPKCHFPGTGYFPKKFGKFPVPSIREHPLPGPDLVPAFGTGCFPVSYIRYQPRKVPSGIVYRGFSGKVSKFGTTRDFPERFWVVPSRPVYFPDFSRIF